MADERRETLLRMFPDYDADILIASMTNASVEQIADWCLNNPERVPMKRKGEKRRHPESAPSSPGGENDSDSDLEFDDIADGLLLDRLIKELLNRLKKEMLLQENKCETFSNEIKFVIMAVYPKLRMDFLRHAFQESGSRLCATLIIGFFVSNKLTQRLRDSMPNPQSNMWVMTDPLNATRKRYALDIFDGDISHYPEQITTPIRKFVTMMNALAEKYPRIINRLELLPEAFQLRLDVPDDIEKFDCAVCFSEYTITRRIMCGAGPSTGPEDERHSFCRNCVKHQAQAATEDMPLAEGGIGLKCMEYKCTHAILYSAVRNLIPKKVRRKIDERIMEENIGNAGLNLERCRECNFAIEMEESKEDNKVFACPNCEKNWCRLCEREWDNDHFGISCAELDDKNKVDKKQRELERRLNEAVIRKCKCGLQFTKSDGCNKMTCRCGKTQCYLCRKEGINYTHFCQHVRVPGAPQQQCQQCDKACTLWADANQLDQQLIQRIRAENDEAVANPDGPGPSRPHAVRRLSPVYRPVPNMVPFFPAAPMQYRMPEMVQQQQPPAAPLRHHHYMPDGFNFGFHNGPQGFNVNVNIENPHNHDGDRLARRNEERMQREMVRQRNRELVRQVQIARREVENAQERAINIARMRDEQYERLQQLRATEEATANMRQDRERLMQMFNDNQAVIRNINQNGVIPEAHPQRRELNFAPQQPLPAPRRRAEIRFAEPKIRNREPQFPDEATAANINQNGQMQQQLQPLMRRHQHFNPTLNLPAPAVHQRQQPNAQNGKAMAINVNRNHEIQHNQRQQLPVFETYAADFHAFHQREHPNAQNGEPNARHEDQNVERRYINFQPRQPEPAIPPHPRREVMGDPAVDPDQVDPPPRIRRHHVRNFLYDIPPAQHHEPLGVNANDDLARFVNINIDQNNMVRINQNPEQVHIRVGAPAEHHVEQEPIIHQAIIGQPLNAQNNMEPAALNIQQHVFEQPDIEFEEEIVQELIPPHAEHDDVFDGDIFDADDILSDLSNDEDEMEQQIMEEINRFNEPLLQQPNELIDLTEDEPPVYETDLKHIERIHDKGERFEVLPIDMNSYVHETRQLDKDWNYVYTLIDELSISNEKMREAVAINDTQQEPEKAEAIRETLDLHNDIANYIKQRMTQLNAQTEKINNV